MKHIIMRIFSFVLIVNIAIAENVNFKNNLWSIGIDSNTLGITAKPNDGKQFLVNDHVISSKSTSIKQNGNQASWQIPEMQLFITAKLSDADLHLEIKSDNTQSLPILKVNSNSHTKGWVLPLFEGVYVPHNEQKWTEILTRYYKTGNTTESLSLPLIGIEQQNYIINYIFLSPFDNIFNWQNPDTNLQFSLKHNFTALDPYSSYKLLITLSDTNRLSGAKRLRKHIQEQGDLYTLRQKIKDNPRTEKLIGASHFYLWGDTLISKHDVLNWPEFLSRLRQNTIIPSRLKSSFSDEVKQYITNDNPLEYQKALIIEELTSSLNNITKNLKEKTLILEELFAQTITKSKYWGDGLSLKLLNKLRSAGITRAWLGLASWKNGKNHHEAILSAQKIGYLVAPYDSYYTALSDTTHKSWETAQMGQGIFNQCGITKIDGTKMPGFNRKGRYLNPVCVNSYYRKRINELQQNMQCNSWFLDADGTGMLFNDYSDNHRLSQAKFAKAINNRIHWLANKHRIPVGSEDGNYVVAKYLAYAHGIQTPVFGWGNKDMMKDRKSEFYLGRYWPAHQPEQFFKTVPVKEFYKHIYFNPRYRIPLYQTVYHDSIITTHHWHFDTFKFNNALQERIMLQLLYNVPPLYHLNLGTFDKRISLIKAIDRFFKPTHMRLAKRALIDFEYLTKDSLIQATTFSDNSKIVANFTNSAYNYHGTTIAAKSVTAFLPGGKPESLSFSALDL